MRSKKPFPAGKPAFVIFMALLLASAFVPTQARARKFKVLHTFHGAPKDGYGPGGQGALVRDATGNLYGTTGGGGRGACGGYTCGTAFKLDKSGKQVWLHSFNGKNGMGPHAGLLQDSVGNLYGTTDLGGYVPCKEDSLGCGTLFKLDKTGRETVLYKFKGKPDGWAADSPVVMDAAGNVYGTTENGGSFESGTIFKVDKSGEETVLYSFTGGSDGCFPIGVILDSGGNLYGVTAFGGSGFCSNGDGVVFKIDTAGEFGVLHTFGGSDGRDPDGLLLLDAKGDLYGTTGYGGTSTACPFGCGTVFKLAPDGSETVLYNFCSLTSCEDGEAPGGGLVRDRAGNLYGVTVFGGLYRNCNRDICGVVFKLDSTGKETVLHSFTGGADGSFPSIGLLRDGLGNLYGATMSGGDLKCEPPYGCGVVYKISP
jgi:uncharacterized repeat protein (TIGR03803 family)